MTDGHVVSLVGGSAPSRWAAWITLTDLSGTVKEQAAAFTEGVLDDGHFSNEAKAWLVFEATQNEAGLILSYEPPSGADKVYLAIQ